jgi:methyl-accepting chemotaxis protein
LGFNELVKTYGSIGAGGLALVVLLWLLVYLVTKISPLLQSLKEGSKVQAEIIKNNTEAIKEVSRSNENVATALKLLNQSFDTFSKLMERHDERAEHIQTEMVKMGANMENVKERLT